MFIPVCVALLSFTSQLVRGDCIGSRFANIAPADSAVTSLFTSLSATQVELSIPPRYMWGWGGSLSGYCGETSLQASALFYGTWISSQHFRYAANNQDTEIIVSDGTSADDFDRDAAVFALRLEHFTGQNTPQVNAYLNWVRGHLYQGHPVIGVTYLKYPKASQGDSDYDHIVPFTGLAMTTSQNSYGTGSSTTTNVSSVTFHDLYSTSSRVMSNPVAATRSEWVLSSGSSMTQPYLYAIPTQADYGVAVLGVRDDNSETYRTKLTAWSWTEPDWGDEDQCNEAPLMMNLSVAVFGLTAGASYSILRFDGNASIPTKNFAAASYARRWDFVATGTTYSVSPLDTILTSSIASYRTVLNTAAGSGTTSAATAATTTQAVGSTSSPATTSASTPTTTTQLPSSSAGGTHVAFSLIAVAFTICAVVMS